MAEPTTTNRGYQKPHPTNLLSQDVGRLIAALDAIDVDVHALLTQALTVAGVKTFSASPVVPTLSAGDSSTKAANAAFVAAAVAALADSPPTALNTLKKLATALGNDANFASTITALIGTKADDEATTNALAGKAAAVHAHSIADVTGLADALAGKPAFSAYVGSTQTVSNGVATKIALTTETFDTDNCFNSSTYRFQPNVAGYYHFTGKVTGAASTSASSCVAFIYKNGASVKQGPDYIAPSGQGMSAGVSGLVYLNGSTDYVEFFATNSGSGTNTFTAGATVSYFDGHFVRPA